MKKPFSVDLIISSIIVAGLIGNSLIMWTIFRIRLYQRPVYVLILTLAVTDWIDELLMVPNYACLLFGLQPLRISLLRMIGFGSDWWGFVLGLVHSVDFSMLTLITVIQSIAVDKKGWLENTFRTKLRIAAIIGIGVGIPLATSTWFFLPGYGLSRHYYNETLQLFVLDHGSMEAKHTFSFMFSLHSLLLIFLCIVCDILIIRKLYTAAMRQQPSPRQISIGIRNDNRFPQTPLRHSNNNYTSSTTAASNNNNSNDDLLKVAKDLALQFVAVNSIYITSTLLNALHIIFFNSASAGQYGPAVAACFQIVSYTRIVLVHTTYASKFYLYMLFNPSFRHHFKESWPPATVSCLQNVGDKCQTLGIRLVQVLSKVKHGSSQAPSSTDVIECTQRTPSTSSEIKIELKNIQKQARH